MTPRVVRCAASVGLRTAGDGVSEPGDGACASSLTPSAAGCVRHGHDRTRRTGPGDRDGDDRRDTPEDAPDGLEPRGAKRGRGRLIGRTKGGLNSKLHVVADAKGRPIRMFLSAGQTSDPRTTSAHERCCPRSRRPGRCWEIGATMSTGSATPRSNWVFGLVSRPAPDGRSRSCTRRTSTASATRSRTCSLV